MLMFRPPVRPLQGVRSRGLAAAAALAAPTLLVGMATYATASTTNGPSISQYHATVTVQRNGDLHVAESVDYDLGSPSVSRLSRTLDLREQFDAERDRVYAIDDLTVKSVQGPLNANLMTSDQRATIDFDLPGPRTRSKRVLFDYRISGAVAGTPDGIEVRWPVLQGFDEPVRNATIEWSAPDVRWQNCLAGAPGSSKPCTTSTLAETAGPTMKELDLPEGGEIVGILGLGPRAVAVDAMFRERWSLSRAFSASGQPLWTALAVLVLGFFAAMLLWWLRGRDAASGRPSPTTYLVTTDDGTVGFAPPGAVRPGQMGTLADERADIVDVTSTVIDLAARNHLFVEELPADSRYGRMDWRLHKRGDPGDELLAYERAVLDALFHDGDTVTISDAGERIRAQLPAIQGLLYDDLVVQGWFGERPDAVRSRWTTAGWVLTLAGVAMTVVLALVSRFGLVGVAILLSGVALTLVAQAAPARTAKGSRVLSELHAFRDYLHRADVDDIPIVRRQELISRFYPYALVFGADERWAEALAATDGDDEPDEPLPWYGAPQDWHLSEIAGSLDRLMATLNAAVASRRPVGEPGQAEGSRR